MLVCFAQFSKVSAAGNDLTNITENHTTFVPRTRDLGLTADYAN